MFTGIIILNYNNTSDTIKCIASIEQFNSAPVKYIVVDNHSTEKDTESILQEAFKGWFGDSCLKSAEEPQGETVLPKVTFLLNQENSGYARGNNYGLRWAYHDPEISSILLLNNDVLFVEDIIPRLKEDSIACPDCGFITPLLIKRDWKSIDHCCARKFVSNWNLMVPFLVHNRNRHKLMTKAEHKQRYILQNPDLLKSDKPFPIDYPSGSCLFIKKDILERIDGFDPETFLYYEEIILYKKLKAIGIQNYCDPQIRVIHLGAKSTGMADNSFLQKCTLDSADVYYRKYGECTPAEKFVWVLTKSSWKIRLGLKSILKNR